MEYPGYVRKISSVIGVSSFLAGAYHGFCDSQEILLNGDLELVLKYGGAVTQGLFIGAMTGKEGWKHKGIIGSPQKFARRKITAEEYEKMIDIFEKEEYAVPGPTTGFVVGAGVGATLTGILTLSGYGIGYLFGRLNK